MNKLHDWPNKATFTKGMYIFMFNLKSLAQHTYLCVCIKMRFHRQNANICILAKPYKYIHGMAYRALRPPSLPATQKALPCGIALLLCVHVFFPTAHRCLFSLR